MQEIIDKIRKERKRQEITQAELSKKMGVCPVTISNIERGKPVTVNTLTKICDALSLKLDVTRK